MREGNIQQQIYRYRYEQREQREERVRDRGLSHLRMSVCVRQDGKRFDALHSCFTPSFAQVTYAAFRNIVDPFPCVNLPRR